MTSKNISRSAIFTSNTPITASEHNAEHDLVVDNINELFKSFDYDGVIHRLRGQYCIFNFSNLDLESLLSTSHNSDGSVKATAVKDANWTVSDLKAFLDVAHNPDGTVKSDGINDPLITAHNNDTSAHADIRADISNLQSDKADTDLNNVTSLGNLLNLDGAGSGLDADMVDGLEASAFALATDLNAHVSSSTDHLTLRRWLALFTLNDGFHQELTYDANGNVSQIDVYTDSTKATLLGSVVLSYDTNGNLTQVSYSFDGQTYTQTLTYDANGNLISVNQV